MSTASTRQQKRAPVTLKIKFKSSTLDQFVERYSVDISQGGIFIRTKSPLEVGTPLRFEFQLKNATPLITGEGTVVWTREYDPSRTGLAPGMGVRFDRLPPESQQVLTKILEQKKARPTAPARRPAPGPDPAEEFVDSPTKVAPRAVIAGLADTSRERFSEDEHVPVDAFEEATKVGLLDELVAKTAEPDLEGEDEPILTSAPRDNSGPIGTATLPELDEPELPMPVKSTDDAPELPMPVSARFHDDDDGVVPPSGFDDEVLDLPAPAPKRPDFPAEIPTELNLAPPPPSKSPKDHAPTDPVVKSPTPAELAAAKSGGIDKPATLLDSVPPLPDRPPPAKADPAPQSAGMTARARESAPPLASKPLAATPHLLRDKEDHTHTEIEPRGGGNGLWIAMAVGIILLAGGGFAFWQLNKDDAPTAKRPDKPANTNNNTAANNGKQIDTPPETPPEPTGLETTVSSPVAGATAALVDDDQSGPTPMTFKGLEEGKAYTVKVTAPGYLPAEVEIKGGEEIEPVKLETKPRFIAVKSSPAGAAVYINKRRRGKTPFELELKGPLAELDELSVQLRRAGYDSVEKTIAKGDTWNEEAERMVAALDLTLSKRAPRVRTNPNNNTNNGSNNNTNGSGDGDGNTGDGNTGDGNTGDGNTGDGNAGDGNTGDGDGNTGDGNTGDGGGTGEPVPDWAKDKAKKEDEAKPKPKPKPAPTPAPSNTLP